MKRVIFFILIVIVFAAGMTMVMAYKFGNDVIETVIRSDLFSEETSVLNENNPGFSVGAADKEISAIRDEFMFKDRMYISSSILMKLSSDDITDLRELMTDGLTAEERKRADEILGSRFTSDEINRFKEIYRKYVRSYNNYTYR